MSRSAVTTLAMVKPMDLVPKPRDVNTRPATSTKMLIVKKAPSLWAKSGRTVHSKAK